MSDSSLEGAVCVPNIKGWGRRRRQRFGQVQLGVAAVLLAALVASRASAYWRLVLFLPLAGAAISLLQVRRNT